MSWFKRSPLRFRGDKVSFSLQGLSYSYQARPLIYSYVYYWPPKQVFHEVDWLFAKFIWGSYEGLDKRHWLGVMLICPTLHNELGIISLQYLSLLLLVNFGESFVLKILCGHILCALSMEILFLFISSHALLMLLTLKLGSVWCLLWKMLNRTFAFVFILDMLHFLWEDWTFSRKLADHALGNSLQDYLYLQIKDVSHQDSWNSLIITSIISTTCSYSIFKSSPCLSTNTYEHR